MPMYNAYTDNENVAIGHVEDQDDMTVTKENIYSSLDLFFLLDHDFVTGVNSGNISDVTTAYTLFTREIVMLFHGSHPKSAIHSALIVVEDHLLIILEDATHLDENLLRYVERAIKFIQRFIARIGEWIKQHPINDSEVAIVSTMVSENEIEVEGASSLQWEGRFTELVEIVFALLISGKVSAKTDAEFIRTIFRILKIKKSLTDYYKVLKKIEEKYPRDDDAPGRCKLLTQLLVDTERELQRRYLGKAA